MNTKAILAKVVHIEKELSALKLRFAAIKKALQDAKSELSVAKQEAEYWKQRYQLHSQLNGQGSEE